MNMDVINNFISNIMSNIMPNIMPNIMSNMNPPEIYPIKIYIGQFFKNSVLNKDPHRVRTFYEKTAQDPNCLDVFLVIKKGEVNMKTLEDH